jgi:hypothetical protein
LTVRWWLSFARSRAQQCTTVQYSTAQYSTVQHSTAQHSTIQYNTEQYATAAGMSEARDMVLGPAGNRIFWGVQANFRPAPKPGIKDLSVLFRLCVFGKSLGGWQSYRPNVGTQLDGHGVEPASFRRGGSSPATHTLARSVAVDFTRDRCRSAWLHSCFVLCRACVVVCRSVGFARIWPYGAPPAAAHSLMVLHTVSVPKLVEKTMVSELPRRVRGRGPEEAQSTSFRGSPGT